MSTLKRESSFSTFFDSPRLVPVASRRLARSTNDPARVGNALANAAGASERERGPHANASAPAQSNEMIKRVFMSRRDFPVASRGAAFASENGAHKTKRMPTYEPHDE
jgi:hypothetical protein